VWVPIVQRNAPCDSCGGKGYLSGIFQQCFKCQGSKLKKFKKFKKLKKNNLRWTSNF
jgi:DnaJ-class molecular chaperone